MFSVTDNYLNFKHLLLFQFTEKYDAEIATPIINSGIQKIGTYKCILYYYNYLAGL